MDQLYRALDVLTLALTKQKKFGLDMDVVAALRDVTKARKELQAKHPMLTPDPDDDGIPRKPRKAKNEHKIEFGCFLDSLGRHL